MDVPTPTKPASVPSDASVKGPLADLRVVEMGQLIAGPFCGQILADFGAEVIKCEPPGKGDPMREWGRKAERSCSLWWAVIARGKKSVTLDLRTAEGQAIAHELIASADILIENFRPGTLERWGLSYETLSARNPGLVMVRVTGYGQTGPYAGRAGFGSIGEAMGGLRYVVGDPATPPSRMGISIGDSLAAMHAALGAMMAIHARARTGRGQVVDSAIYEAVLNMMESLVTDYDQTGHVRERTGAILPRIAPSNVYPTADGRWIVIGANQDSVFSRFCAAMGEPHLSADPRYATHSARGERQEELDDHIAAWTRTLPLAALEDILAEAGVPAGRIYTAADMVADPHFSARGAIIDAAHPDYGALKMQNVAPRLSETPGAVRAAAPGLGAHNEEVFGSLLGMSEDERADYRTRGII